MNSWLLVLLMVMIFSFLKSIFMGCILLLILTAWMCVELASLGETWFAYILALTYAGGMLVMFTYLCSLCTKIKVEAGLNKNTFAPWVILVVVTALSEAFQPMKMLDSWQSVFSFYMSAEVGSTAFAAFYLTMGLLVCMTMMEKYLGPLKQNYTN